ncbi:MAG TPA: ATP-binding protein [Mucilaginibacter sp.]|jgi:signal transduction histidine kinase
MTKEADFFNFSIKKILSTDQSIFERARIRLLYYGFWIVFIAVAGLLISVYFQHKVILTITAGIVLVCVTCLFKYLTYRPNWRQISHSLLVMATLVNLNNVFITMQSVDIVTIQVILLTILFSYYMLGQRWGLFYSLVNLVPVLFFLLLEYFGDYFISLKPEQVDQTTIIISVFANFIIIIYIHSYFYGAFLNSIKQLKKTGDEQLDLNAKLEMAIEKAEKSSQVKTEFLSIMSHEIRTPLNAVIGMCNLMIMANPRPDQKENLNVLKFSANNLLAIVNDVLDFNKIEAGKVIFEHNKLNLAELMHNICGAQILKAEEKGLSFDLEIDPVLNDKIVFGDATRITQIIYNLVSNAIKFTKHGNIWVDVTCLEDRHNTIIANFRVRDTGIGIEKKDLESIFEPFTQESVTSTRQYGGTGLGLAIVKRLLELQGLYMKVVSKIGEGSEFSFDMEFPVSTQTNEEIIPIAIEQNEGLSNLRMLIAEDNPVNVLLMKKLLSKWNIIPTIAENGERAIEMLQYGNFDIILMDLQMPVLNGFDAAMEIRKLPDPKKSSIPIIALTAAALYDIKEEIFKAGMNDYVAKPFKPEYLMEKIQHLVVVP